MCNLVNEAIIKHKAKADEQKRIKFDKPVKLMTLHLELTACHIFSIHNVSADVCGLKHLLNIERAEKIRSSNVAWQIDLK